MDAAIGARRTGYKQGKADAVRDAELTNETDSLAIDQFLAHLDQIDMEALEALAERQKERKAASSCRPAGSS